MAIEKFSKEHLTKFGDISILTLNLIGLIKSDIKTKLKVAMIL